MTPWSRIGADGRPTGDKMLDNLLKRTRERRRAARELDAAILAVNSGAEVNGREVGLLLDAASNPSNADFSRKLAAVRALMCVKLPEEECARAARELCKQARSDAGRLDARGRFRRIAGAFGQVGLTSIILVVLGILLAPPAPPAVPDASFSSWLLVGSGLVLGFLAVPVALIMAGHEGNNLQTMRAWATKALGWWREPGTIGVLVRNLYDSNPQVARAADESLPGVLSSALRDEIPLPPDADVYLVPLLRRWDEGLVLMILEVLRRQGRGSVAERVGRLVKRGRTERIRVVAAVVLPVLLERMRAEQDSKVLLRPCGAPEGSPDELLRPAQGEPEADPGTLLRPAGEYESGEEKESLLNNLTTNPKE